MVAALAALKAPGKEPIIRPSPFFPQVYGMDKVARRQVALWLFVCSAMVFSILVVGGVTRLTHSGLTIVEWKPIDGIIPPLNQAQWDETFDKYKQTPEFQKVNHQMDLDEFKGIFFWEYWHRVLGRLIGVVFLAVSYTHLTLPTSDLV